MRRGGAVFLLALILRCRPAAGFGRVARPAAPRLPRAPDAALPCLLPPGPRAPGSAARRGGRIRLGLGSRAARTARAGDDTRPPRGPGRCVERVGDAAALRHRDGDGGVARPFGHHRQHERLAAPGLHARVHPRPAAAPVARLRARCQGGVRPCAARLPQPVPARLVHRGPRHFCREPLHRPGTAERRRLVHDRRGPRARGGAGAHGPGDRRPGAVARRDSGRISTAASSPNTWRSGSERRNSESWGDVPPGGFPTSHPQLTAGRTAKASASCGPITSDR